MALSSTKLVIAIFVCVLAKIFLAIYLPLVNDEAYAIAVSKEFSLSFFDHPPIGFWSSSLFTEILGFGNVFTFRLPYLLFGLGTTLVLFQLGKEIGNDEVGLWSALLYNTAPFFVISGGFLVVPDGPLNLAIATASLCVIRLHKEPSWKVNFLLILLGLCLAFAFASKYQAFLFGFGCLLVLLISPKRAIFLKNPSFYLCFFIATLGLLPTVLWNAQNHWISFQFHGSRQGGGINLGNFVQMILGMIVYLLPPVVLIPMKFLTFSLSKNNSTEDRLSPMEKILVVMALPNILIFAFVFLFSKDTFPHWIMPGWLLLLPIVARSLSLYRNRFHRLSYGVSILITCPILATLVIHSQTGLLTNHLQETPKWDNTLEVIDWRPLQTPIQQIINNKIIQNEKPKLAALTWMEAGQLSTTMHNKYETLVLDGDPHHFSFLQKSESPSFTFLVKISLGIKPSIEATLERIQKYDKTATHLEDIIVYRGSRDYATASIYLLRL